MARVVLKPIPPKTLPSDGLGSDFVVVLRDGDLPRLRFLLQNGADADTRIEDPQQYDLPGEIGQRAPLLVITAALGDLEAMRLLVNFGAGIDARTHHEEDCFFSGTSFLRSGGSALTFAASFGHEEMVDFLLLRGCDPNIGDCFRRTPLALASGNGNQRIVRRLLQEKGRLKLEAADWEKRDALKYAADNGHITIYRMLKKAGVRGQSVINWQAALFHAATTGDLEHLKEALRQGGTLDGKDTVFGDSPLHLACRHGQERIAMFLVDLGARIDAVNEWTETPLMVALKHRHGNLVRFMLSQKPQVNHRSKFLDTPLQMAVRSELPPLLKMLLSCGLPFSLRDIEEARRLAKRLGNPNMLALFTHYFGTKSPLPASFRD
jgi:ankyrin repeat protein